MDEPDAIVKHFSRFLVCMGWADDTLQREGSRFISTTGFLVEIDHQWLLMTSGHVLEDLAEAIQGGQKLHGFSLYDGFSPANEWNHRIPFSLPEITKVFEVDEEFDYGAIPLDPMLQEKLRRNGKLAFRESEWDVPPGDPADSYMMLGFPSEDTHITKSNLLSINVVMMDVDKLSLTDVPDACRKSDRLFYGRIPSEFFADPARIKDIDGMSGGPILAVKRMPDGSFRFWVEAIQSGWFRSHRITTACYLKPSITKARHRITNPAPPPPPQSPP